MKIDENTSFTVIGKGPKKAEIILKTKVSKKHTEYETRHLKYHDGRGWSDNYGNWYKL